MKNIQAENSLRLLIAGAEEVPEPRSFLSEAELLKAASFRTGKRRADWLGGRFAAKTLVRETFAAGTPLTSIVIDQDRFGRPSWREGERLRLLSITHSGPYCAAACAEKDAVFLGIDLEKAEPREPAWYRDYFFAGELEGGPAAGSPPGTKGVPDFVIATRLWTRKEALLKALGLGLKADPLDIDLSQPGSGFRRAAAARYEELGRPAFRLRTIEHGPDYCLSFAWQCIEENNGSR